MFHVVGTSIFTLSNGDIYSLKNYVNFKVVEFEYVGNSPNMIKSNFKFKITDSDAEL